MKKKLLLLTLLAGGITAWGQKTSMTKPAPANSLPTRTETSFGGSIEKTLLCQDTIRYPQAKEQILGTNTFYFFDTWEFFNEEFSQTYLNTGPISIGGVEFFGSNNTTDGMPSVTVTASIYNVNAANVPTTLIASGTTTFTSTVAGYHYVSFTPVTVSGNYAVVIRPTNTDGVLNLYVNDQVIGQPYDEDFSRVKSDYYPTSSGAWVSVPVVSANNANFEPLVAPIISYTINTSFTATPNPACLGTPVVFTGTNTPTATLNNRMYNYQKFEQYFEGAPDSTYVYDMDNGTEVWSNNANYTYPAAGTYDVTYYTLGGFWNSCADFTSTQVVINPIPATPTITPGGPTTFCAGGSVTLTSSAASGNLWSTGATTASINASATSTVTVTTTALGCTSAASAPVTVTVNPLDNAGFAYVSNTLCTGGANETPTVSTAGGSFSSTPAGLDIDPATGEIDMTTSTDGTYSVTYTTAGTCPNSSSQNITITASPDASFTYSAATFCSADSDPAPSFGAGASGGTFTADAAGLSINSSTGVVDLSASTAGTYVVTNTIAAAGVCPMVDEDFTITVNATPTATVSGGGTQCGAGSIPVTISLTGSGPWDFSYSDGVTTTPITGEAGTTYTINATANGTYTVTTVTSSGCSATGTGSATVVFNPNPVVTIGGLTAVCENGTAVSLTATPAGGTFSGTGVSGSTFDPSIGAGTYAIDYDFTDANGCSGSATTNIVVNAAPSVAITALPDLCVYNSAVALTQGTPAGGTYSGAGVSGGSFDPSTAGAGTHVITYTYTTGDGCTGTALENLVVDSCLSVNELSETDLMIVPNPANDVITISYTNTTQGIVELSLTSTDGKIVAFRTVEASASFNEKLDVSALSSGVYFVKLNMNTGTVSKKIIVQ